MLGSSSENICAVWNALMRPRGDSMKTRTPCLPRIAYSAALPVSPEVAPTMLSGLPVFASAYSNRLPSNCIARSLNASVGPFDSPSSRSSGATAASAVSGTIS